MEYLSAGGTGGGGGGGKLVYYDDDRGVRLSEVRAGGTTAVLATTTPLFESDLGKWIVVQRGIRGRSYSRPIWALITAVDVTTRTITIDKSYTYNTANGAVVESTGWPTLGTGGKPGEEGIIAPFAGVGSVFPFEYTPPFRIELGCSPLGQSSTGIIAYNQSLHYSVVNAQLYNSETLVKYFQIYGNRFYNGVTRANPHEIGFGTSGNSYDIINWDSEENELKIVKGGGTNIVVAVTSLAIYK